MPLRIQVTGEQREALGVACTHEFKACGGTIGRSLKCDWAIPDSKRYISSRHARIDYHSGAYYLVDLSRNGIFVNGADKPLGKGNPQRLFDRDLIRIGEYHMEIAIFEDAREAHDDGMQDSVVRAQMVAEDESLKMSTLSPDNISDSMVLELMLKPSGDSGELSDINEVLINDTKRISSDDGADHFIKAAGLDPLDFKGIDAKNLLQVAAQLLCAFAEGTHMLLQSQDALTRQFKLNNKTTSGTANPLRAADGIDSALRLLFSSRNDVHKTGTEAVNAAFNELKSHQQSVIPAMQEALAYYLGYFQPESIDKYIEELKQRTGIQQTEFRELYAEAYNGLANNKKGKLPRQFDEEFSKAYEFETGNN